MREYHPPPRFTCPMSHVTCQVPLNTRFLPPYMNETMRAEVPNNQQFFSFEYKTFICVAEWMHFTQQLDNSLGLQKYFSIG